MKAYQGLKNLIFDERMLTNGLNVKMVVEPWIRDILATIMVSVQLRNDQRCDKSFISNFSVENYMCFRGQIRQKPDFLAECERM